MKKTHIWQLKIGKTSPMSGHTILHGEAVNDPEAIKEQLVGCIATLNQSEYDEHGGQFERFLVADFKTNEPKPEPIKIIE